MRAPSAPAHPASLPQAPHADGRLVSAWLTNLQFNWEEVTRGTRIRAFTKDETLFLEGQSADTVYVIQEGRVRLTSFDFDGKERHLMIIGPTGLAGDCALRAALSYTVSAVAATDSRVWMVPAATMLSALVQDAHLAAQHQLLSGMRFRILMRHVAVQGSNSSRRRVCLHLLDLMHSYGATHHLGRLITISFTQQEMGSICGLSRVSVSQIFSQLEREQVIARAGRLVVIVDTARLEVLSRS